MNYIRLKEIREDRDITQEEIAKLLEISQAQYSRYETGENLITVDKLDLLANYYNTSTDYLLGRTDELKTYSRSIIDIISAPKKRKNKIKN